MDIGILSMQEVYNYGSVLQAYALREMLHTNSSSVSYIDIERRSEENSIASRVLPENIASKEKFNRPSRCLDKYLTNRILHRVQSGYQRTALNRFMVDYLSGDKSHSSDSYDTCVIGSDEVFNCLQRASWGFTTQLFGNVLNANRVITYAASCGWTKYEDIPAELLGLIRRAMSNLASISVRDENTAKFVRYCDGRDPLIHLDPALVYDFSKEMESNTPTQLPDKYCIVYAYRGRINSKNEIEEIRAVCKRMSLKIISLGSPQPWISKHLVCSPFELLSVFKGAELAITDTFHGTIFATKFAKHAAIMLRDSNRNKLCDLVARVGMEKHVLRDPIELGAVAKINKDQMFIDQVISHERQRSLAYLRENV